VRVAQAALVLVVVYCGSLAFVQAHARGKAEQLARALADDASDGRVLRVAATPVLADPLTWRCLADAERSTLRFDIKLGDVYPEELRGVADFRKAEGEEAEVVRLASEDAAARVLLDFARFPVARVVRAPSGGLVVQFADLRYTAPGSRARVGGFALDVPLEDSGRGRGP
jgi:hypothetical protein